MVYKDFDLDLVDADTGRGRRGLYRRVGKRVFDLALGIAIAPIVLPAIGALWLLARRDGGPGFFAHTRMGQDGKPFRCLKIRTMVPDAETRLVAYLDSNPEARAEWERDVKLTNDPRITKIGHVLRRTSLDELPQLLNVFQGAMSFVGPRPVPAAELERYGAAKPVYLAVKPGITGLWQVSGRNDVSYGERIEMDRRYLRDMSFAMDLRIILKTAGAVLSRTGK